MEISPEMLVSLASGQARTEQAVKDLIVRFDKVVPALVQNDEKLEKRIRSVEKQQWYFGGAGTVLGGLLTYMGEHLKLLGGK